MDKQIHQIYSTHCTYKSAFLENRQGDMADRALGYAARASSMPKHDLRRQYNTLERFLSYQLPSDSPPSAKLENDADSAPQRMVYHNSVSGMQMLANICYRKWDAVESSAGSYFAHLFITERNGTDPPWPILEAIQLWKSPLWVKEDSDAIKHQLEPCSSFAVLQQNWTPIVNDTVLESFLTTSANGDFNVSDPAMIPSRWREMDASKRQALFLTAFRGYLQIAENRRQSLLLIVEPEIAILFFYGIARLLPAGSLRDSISFSTYEGNPARLSTTLAATTLFDPSVNDLPPDIYQRECVLNTYSGKQSQIDQPDHNYANLILEELSGNSWGTVDPILARMNGFNAANSVDSLKHFTAAERQMQAIASKCDMELKPQIANDRKLKEYVREAVCQRLRELADHSTEEPWAKAPKCLMIVLELTATEEPTETTKSTRVRADEKCLQPLIDQVRSEDIATLLGYDTVARRFKAYALLKFTKQRKKLPPGCDYLWNDLTKTRNKSDSHEIVKTLLTNLDGPTWQRLYESIPGTSRVAVIALMIDICTHENHSSLNSNAAEAPPDTKTNVVSELIGKLSESQRCNLIIGCPTLKSLPKSLKAAFASHLPSILKSLIGPTKKGEFALRFQAIRAAGFLLTENTNTRSESQGPDFPQKAIQSLTDLCRHLTKLAQDRKEAAAHTPSSARATLGFLRSLFDLLTTFKWPKHKDQLRLALESSSLDFDLAGVLIETTTKLLYIGQVNDRSLSPDSKQAIHLLKGIMAFEKIPKDILPTSFNNDLKRYIAVGKEGLINWPGHKDLQKENEARLARWSFQKHPVRYSLLAAVVSSMLTILLFYFLAPDSRNSDNHLDSPIAASDTNKSETDKSETDKSETDNSETDDSETDDNKTDDNKTDDNKTDDNKTDDNKTDDSDRATDLANKSDGPDANTSEPTPDRKTYTWSQGDPGNKHIHPASTHFDNPEHFITCWTSIDNEDAEAIHTLGWLSESNKEVDAAPTEDAPLGKEYLYDDGTTERGVATLTLGKMLKLHRQQEIKDPDAKRAGDALFKSGVFAIKHKNGTWNFYTPKYNDGDTFASNHIQNHSASFDIHGTKPGSLVLRDGSITIGGQKYQLSGDSSDTWMPIIPDPPKTPAINKITVKVDISKAENKLVLSIHPTSEEYKQRIATQEREKKKALTDERKNKPFKKYSKMLKKLPEHLPELAELVGEPVPVAPDPKSPMQERQKQKQKLIKEKQTIRKKVEEYLKPKAGKPFDKEIKKLKTLQNEISTMEIKLRLWREFEITPDNVVLQVPAYLEPSVETRTSDEPTE